MSTVLSISVKRRYGLARVCRVWGVARAGIYRWREAANLPTPPRRWPGPDGPMPRSTAPRHEALEPVRLGIKARFGAIGKDAAAGFSLRHDHGSQYMAHDFQNGIRWLGISSSPAFIRAPEGNGCAERVRHGARTGGALMAHSGR